MTARDIRPTSRSISALAAALTAAGLVVLLVGTAKAAPLVFFGTTEERASLHTGRLVMIAAIAILAAAAALLAARGDLVRAALVLAPGVVATALVYAFPKTALAWPALVVLGPIALFAALTSFGRLGR